MLLWEPVSWQSDAGSICSITASLKRQAFVIDQLSDSGGAHGGGELAFSHEDILHPGVGVIHGQMRNCRVADRNVFLKDNHSFLQAGSALIGVGIEIVNSSLILVVAS